MLCSEGVEIWPLYLPSGDGKNQPFRCEEIVDSQIGQLHICTRYGPRDKTESQILSTRVFTSAWMQGSSLGLLFSQAPGAAMSGNCV